MTREEIAIHIEEVIRAEPMTTLVVITAEQAREVIAALREPKLQFVDVVVTGENLKREQFRRQAFAKLEQVVEEAAGIADARKADIVVSNDHTIYFVDATRIAFLRKALAALDESDD